jgi:tRNA A-37 threonylcarbamoyl transferase component Bud32
MRPGFSLGLVVAPALLAQSQPTFYAAYQDGLDAERQRQWRVAAADFHRAIELRPASAARVIIYGNNLLKDYSPHTHLARCLLELGEPEASRAALAEAARYAEPRAEREALAEALSRRTQPRPGPEEPARKTAPAEALPTVHPPPPPQVQEPRPQAEPAAPSLEFPPPAEPVPSAPASREPARQLRANEPAPAPAASETPVQPPNPPARSSLFPQLKWPIALLLALSGILLVRRRRKPAAEDTSYRDPEQLGPYRIERLLGRGGFASTYLARHASTKQLVALKLLHPYRHDDPEFLRRFRQEARLGAMLDHPNLVRLLDPGPDAGPPWLAMEYIPGRRLDQKLREDGPPALPEFHRIALQIARAMAYAHGLGIVHRDLKPGNVICEGEQVKVMDFGISRIVDSNTLTTTYAFLGTPRYAAPEAQLKAQVGPAADRYAFGIMLFEMLAGHPPFDGETPFEILDQHQRCPLPDLAALRPDLPERLLDLVQALCRKEPGQRPEDEEVIRTLEQLGTVPSPSPARGAVAGHPGS